MVYIYKKTKVFYRVFGKGNKLIVLMHGWGLDSSLMLPLYEKIAAFNYKKIAPFNNDDLSNDFKYLLIDFPPFGRSQEPAEIWTLNNYVDLVEKLINIQEDISEIVLIGHSFGGRVAIKIAASKKIKIDKMILFSSAGIKTRFSIKTKYRILKYKLLKKLKIKNNLLGSKDYQNLYPFMKKTFINIIKEDLKKICRNIDCETLIIFGDKDKETPLYMGKTLHKNIKNSQLIVVEKGEHLLYLDNLKELLPVLNSFINLKML